MRKTTWFASILSLVCLLVVACAGSEQQRFEKMGKKSNVLSNCATQIPVGKTAKVGEGKSVKICVYKAPEKGLTEEALKLLEAAPLAYGESYISREIKIKGHVKAAEITVTPGTPKVKGSKAPSVASKREGKLGTSVNVLLRLEDGVAPEKAKAVKTYIEKVCMEERILPALERSMPSLKVGIEFMLEDENNGDWDQVLKISKFESKDEKEKNHPRYAMEIWPFHSDLYPSGSKACVESCLKKADQGSDDPQEIVCAKSCAKSESEPFCQSLAKLASHWLGAKDAVAETSCQPPEDEITKLSMARTLTRGYVRVAAAEEASSDTAPGTENGADSAKTDKSDPKKDDAAKKADTATGKKDPKAAVAGPEEFWKTASIDMRTGIGDVLAPVCKSSEPAKTAPKKP